MTETESEDWRESAYLNKSNWPKAIPWMGPKREYGPYPWGRPTHKNPHDVDNYPPSHPTAGSVGGHYAGDVCPYCGKPLALDEKAVNINGERGELHEISPDQNQVPSYHPDCWDNRQAKIARIENHTLDQFPTGES